MPPPPRASVPLLLLGILPATACTPASTPPLHPATPAYAPATSAGPLPPADPAEPEPPDDPLAAALPEPRPFVGRPAPRAWGGHSRYRSPFLPPEECFDGALPAAHIREKLVASRGRFRACYGDALRRDPSVAGRVTVAFTVDLEGGVGELQVESNATGDERLGECVAGVVRALRFLCNAGPARVRYPVAFRRGD